MHQLRSKKILFYFFLFTVLGTTHNLYLEKNNFPKIKNIQIIGLNKDESNKVLEDLDFLDSENLFFLNSLRIKNVLSSNSFVETFSVFRKFPHSLQINIKKAEIIANRYINGSNFLIGSNGRLMKTKKKIEGKPNVFGNFRNSEYLRLKHIIDNSNLPYEDIESIYYFDSKRWDLKTVDNILIKLPQKNIKDALKLVVELLSYQKFANIKTIDVRINNQVILNE